MLKIYDAPSARQSLLKRKAPDEFEVSAAVLQGIEQIFEEKLSPSQAVQRILKDVRQRGDQALVDWSRKLDGVAPKAFRIADSEIKSALQNLPEEQRQSLEFMLQRIQGFHQRQPLTSWMTNDLGGTLGQFMRPIRRVGLYVPGGTAPLPSSVLMSAVPAKVAGVPEIVVVAPPQRQTGQVAPVILAAAAIAGVDEVYMLGGAQAIAALAYGTQSIAPVDKIFGPGNLFVTLAKQQVFGVVGIDGLAGPTETVVIADQNARPAWVAADLLAQAEHDVLASAILLTPSQPLAEAVQVEVGRQMESLSRGQILQASLQNRSGIVLTADLQEAAELANLYAPEHLCLAVSDPWALSEQIYAAGGVFLGEHSFEVLGDYVAGPSHVMPTGGSARFASPLNVWDFIHIVSLVALDRATAQQIAPAAIQVAYAEGLDAHARAAEYRLEKNRSEKV
ncbi:MAG: histidinol dehydrogenase [Anaerolineales bacterium]